LHAKVQQRSVKATDDAADNSNMNDNAGIARPWLFRGIRLLEALGLFTVFFALASSRWLIAAAGAIVIVTSYWIYRRWFPVIHPQRDGTMGPSDGGD
jgi:hypothetical protein